jgi:hypothetical protein
MPEVVSVHAQKRGTTVTSHIARVATATRGTRVLRAALFIILLFAAMSAQVGSAPREPYSCRLYVDAH